MSGQGASLPLRRIPSRNIFILAVLAVSGLAGGQQTRTEITNATTTANDAKLNTDTVPDAYAVSSQFERVLVLRFKYQTDLLTGLESMVKEHKIRNAVILSGIGSVRGLSHPRGQQPHLSPHRPLHQERNGASRSDERAMVTLSTAGCTRT